MAGSSRNIQQSLNFPAPSGNIKKHNIEGLESLKQYFLEFIDRLDKKLKDQYSLFDHSYIYFRENFPHFEKDLLDLENLKIDSENHVKKIEKLLRKNSQFAASTSTSR